MFGLLGLAAAALGLAILLLPFWSFVRVYRLTAEVARLRARVDQLERGAWSPHAPGVRAAASSAPPPVEPSVDKAPDPVSPPAEPAQRPQEPLRTPTASAGQTASPTDDLESRVGGRWLLYAGVAILLVGVSFFLKYAFDNEWISPATRVLVGGLAGLALVAAGWRIARTLENFGLALTGVGLASLYLSIYAAFGLYALIGPWTAFGAMAGTTLLATALGDRGRSQVLAMIAAVGGFLTPFLVAGTSHETVLLLSYLLLLAAGIMVLSARHRWAPLAAAGYVLTLGALMIWAASGYADDEWLVVLAFLTAFCALFIWMLRDFATRKGEHAFLVTALLFTAPVLYHLAALVITSNHLPAFQLYLIVFTVAGLLLTTTPHRGWIRLLFLLGAYVPFLGFLQYSGGASLATNLVAAVALAILHVVAMLDRVLRQDERLALPDLLVLHASMIGLFGLLSQILAADAPDWRGGSGAILALGAAGLWFSLARRDPVTAINAAGLSFTLVALAIAVQFDGRVAVIGWAAEGAAAAWIGLRAASPAFRAGGLALLGLAAARLSENYVEVPGVGAVVFNARSLATLVLVALAYLLARAWRRSRPAGPSGSLVPVALEIGAAVFTMMWLSAEIAAYWDTRPRTVQAALGEELMRSLAWTVYGAALIVIGMWRALPSIRWIGIAVIGITILKVFLVDLSRLGGIYRVAGFLVIGVLLVLVSYLYQRTRETRAGSPPADRPAGEAGGAP